MSRIILSDRSCNRSCHCEQFRITRKDLPDVLLPARGLEQILSHPGVEGPRALAQKACRPTRGAH